MVFLLKNFSVQNSCDKGINANARAIEQVLPNTENESGTRLAILNAVASLQVFFEDIYPGYELCMVGERESVRKDLSTSGCCDDCKNPELDFGSKPHPFIHLGNDDLEGYPLVQRLQIMELNRFAGNPDSSWNVAKPSLGTHTMGLVDTTVKPSLEACGYGVPTEFGVAAYTSSSCISVKKKVKLLISSGQLTSSTTGPPNGKPILGKGGACYTTYHGHHPSGSECNACLQALNNL